MDLAQQGIEMNNFEALTHELRLHIDAADSFKEMWMEVCRELDEEKQKNAIEIKPKHDDSARLAWVIDNGVSIKRTWNVALKMERYHICWPDGSYDPIDHASAKEAIDYRRLANLPYFDNLA